MRTTGPLIRVLDTILEDHGADVYGLDIVRRTRLKSGTIYPLLDRLEQFGWLSSRWEDVDPSQAGRPRKRLYTLTGLGQREALALLQANRGLAWA